MKTRSIAIALVVAASSNAAEPIEIWPGMAPGETEKHLGEALPQRANENPPATRIAKITQPTLSAFLPASGGNGAAVVVLPGGGYNYVVADKEGSETARFLHPLGISVFVLHYRTNSDTKVADRWRRPLQDSQRAIRFLRANAEKWKLDPKKIGLLAFSAGGQVGAIHIGEFGDAYEKVDVVDEQSARPDFAMLVYPWNVGDSVTGELMKEIEIGKSAPPTFLVHTDDDKSSSLGSVSIYAALKKAGVPSELHVYQNGGHGYGMREVKGSAVGSWSERAADWLVARGIGKVVPKKTAEQRSVEATLRVLDVCLAGYQKAAGAFPTTRQGLNALVDEPLAGPAPKPYRAFLRRAEVDPWGNPYGYRYPPRENKGKPDVYSKGPDGRGGTADDIGNWLTE